MATLRKINSEYYVRMRLPGGKEKTIPTGTGNRREAERKLKLVQDNVFPLRAGLIIDSYASMILEIMYLSWVVE